MDSLVSVHVHPSAFPSAQRADLLQAFAARCIPAKFHYDTPRRAQRWLAVHAAHSPARLDPAVQALYARAAAGALERLPADRAVRMVGLGCGGGWKEAQLLRLGGDRALPLRYVPLDLSLALVLEARAAALPFVPDARIHPVVADLASVRALRSALQALPEPEALHCFTCFGLVPNFDPADFFSRLSGWLRPGDWLLFSANLVPGTDPAEGLARILLQYDNAATRLWLGTLLHDYGAESEDGALRFRAEEPESESAVRRVVVDWECRRDTTLRVEEEVFRYAAGDRLRLLTSCRYQPEEVRTRLAEAGLAVEEQWVAPSGEEGVFLARRS